MRYGLIAAWAALALALGGRVAAQSLAQRVSGAGDGRVQLRFASRPGVCGDGRGTISTGDHNVMRGNWSTGDDTNWRRFCAPGPVRVVMSTSHGGVDRLRVSIGGNDSGATVHDLGTVSAPDAAQYLLDLARDASNSVGEDAVLAGVLADSTTPWPSLLTLARDARSADTRQNAAFWLGRAAAASVNGTQMFGASDEPAETPDEDVRGQAIFALSQQPHNESVPVLIQVARTNPDPVLRSKALFWLSQTGDDRAIDLFAQILRVQH
ncbi:MAG TPA: HEAT repeat domain-containing protein [Gemmatimonadaceae bacterium]|nr:HEAT repeat domain-containing protein [Gemmatimonadaceae bacterium]